MHPTLFLLLSSMVFTTSLRAQTIYTAEPNAPHQVLLIVDTEYGDILELSAEVARYQATHYLDAPLTTKAIRLIREPEQFAVQLTGFANEAEALRYTALVAQRHPDFVREGMLEAYFPISVANFAELYRAQSTKAYAAFARARYGAD